MPQLRPSGFRRLMPHVATVAMLAVFLIAPGLLEGDPGRNSVAAQEPPATHVLELAPGGNLVGWGGASSVTDATASIAGQFDAVFAVLTESVEWILRRTSEFDVQMQEASTMAEPIEYMARAVLLLATQPLELVSGRVTYSQKILREFGELEEAEGAGIDTPGSGFSSL